MAAGVGAGVDFGGVDEDGEDGNYGYGVVNFWCFNYDNYGNY